MEQDWASAACRWLDEFGWSELERDGFTQVDIDWFSDDAPSRPVAAALDVVRAALALVQQRVRGMDGLVTVPLPYADGLGAEAPGLSEVLDADWDYGPGHEVVGLYVLDPEQLEPADGVEEVRVPYPKNESLPAPLTAYYRCSRSEGEGCVEYDRTIYIRLNATI